MLSKSNVYTFQSLKSNLKMKCEYTTFLDVIMLEAGAFLGAEYKNISYIK